MRGHLAFPRAKGVGSSGVQPFNPPHAMYRVLGSDQKEYGPVTAEQLRQWIAQGRANSQSKARTEDGADWKPLADFPEFAAAFRPPPLPTTAVGTATSPPPAAAPAKASTGVVIAVIASACVLFVLLLVGFFAALLLPALAKAKQKAQTIQCVNNLKQLALGVRMYAGDSKDQFPAGTNWCDAVFTYVSTPSVFRCPAAKDSARCHYAFNAKLSAIAEDKLTDQAWQTVLLFEADGGWNLSGGKELLAQTVRHHGVVTVALADGSVRQVRAADLPSLRWEP